MRAYRRSTPPKLIAMPPLFGTHALVASTDAYIAWTDAIIALRNAAIAQTEARIAGSGGRRRRFGLGLQGSVFPGNGTIVKAAKSAPLFRG
jgi:hypothetical protein